MAQLSETCQSVPAKLLIKPVFGSKQTGNKKSNYEDHLAGNR